MGTAGRAASALPGSPGLAAGTAGRARTGRKAAGVASRGDPPAAHAFVGRAAEMELLERAWARAGEGIPQWVALLGEPGIGKTRLAEEACRTAAARGAVVVWGRAFEGDGAPPFWPWIQALRALGARDLDLCLEARGRSPAARRGSAPEVAAGEHAQDRFRFFEAVAAVLRAASAAGPVLVVLDDLHAADESSQLLLAFLIRELREASLLTLAIYRTLDVPCASTNGNAIARVARDCVRLRLRGIGVEAVESYLEAVAGRPPGAPLTALLHRATDGNPLFLSEVVRLLCENGELASAELGRIDIPDAVRDVLRLRLEPISAETRRVLGAAAVIGREFDVALLERTEGRPVREVLRNLDEAEAAGVVACDPARPGTYRFKHDLVVRILYDGLSSASRSDLHGRIGEALEELPAARGGESLAAIAHHFRAASPTGGSDRALRAALRAGDRSMQVFAYEDAARQYAWALESPSIPAAERVRVLVDLGVAQSRAGEAAAARASLLRAWDLARPLGCARTLARVALTFGGTLAETGVLDQALLSMLQHAIDALGRDEPAVRCTLLARLAVAVYFAPDASRRLALSEEALRLARENAHPSLVAVALRARHLSIWGPDTLAERLALSGEIEALQDGGVPPVDGHVWRIVDLLEAGDVAEADRALQTYEIRADVHRLAASAWHAAVLRATRATMMGKRDEAERLAARALELGLRRSVANAAEFHAVQTFLLRRDAGELESLEPAVRAFVGQYPNLAIWRCGFAYLLSELGRHDEARAELRVLSAQRCGAIPRDGNWLPSLAFLAQTCAALGDAERAAVVAELLGPFARQNVIVATGAGFLGPVSFFLGLLAATAGRSDEATRHLRDALAACDDMGARGAAATAAFHLARLLAGRAGPEAREAVELLERASAEAARMGMTRLERHALAALAAPARVGRGEEAAALETSSAPPLGPQGPAPRRGVFRRDGGIFRIELAGEHVLLKASRGLDYVALLLRHPDRDFPVRELADPGAPAADAPLKERVQALADAFDEAVGFNDLGRAALARSALEQARAELARRAGQGDASGDTRAAAERTRVAVTKAIHVAFKAIGAHAPAMRRYLVNAIRTGRLCSYRPDPSAPVVWEL